MKKLLCILCLACLAYPLPAQDITGAWHGLLSVQGLQLRLVLNVTKTNDAYSATLDSPDQGAKGIPVTTVSYAANTLKFAVERAKIEYTGVLNDKNIFVGTFKQNGQSFEMNLSREEAQKVALVRPQEPQKPYPYRSEDVTFENKQDNITLAGTLTLPTEAGKYPVVVLISGSGAQNRDEELMGHKPFLVLADHLTKKGIGVLRFDDRGTAASKGNFATATTADFAKDVAAAVAYLKTRPEINPAKIGLIGHSEGGIIAPMVASQSKDVRFIVLLAGTGLRGAEILLLQQELIGSAAGISEADLAKQKKINKASFDILLKAATPAEAKKNLTEYLQKNIQEVPDKGGLSDEEFIKMSVAQITNTWMAFFLKYDPTEALSKVKCPILALNGAKDLQVPPKENLQAIQKALKKAGNKQVTIQELPNLNHLFQECSTGAPTEYDKIEQTFSPTALQAITDWLQQQVR